MARRRRRLSLVLRPIFLRVLFIAELPEVIPCDVMLGEDVHVGTQPA